MKVDPNAPAYPQPLGLMAHDSGMPIRLAIAAQIMASVPHTGSRLIDKQGKYGSGVDFRAKCALEWADALIEAHNEGQL